MLPIPTIDKEGNDIVFDADATWLYIRDDAGCILVSPAGVKFQLGEPMPVIMEKVLRAAREGGEDDTEH